MTPTPCLVPNDELPIPPAVTFAQVDSAVHEFCERVPLGEQALKTDIQWPPGSVHWWRPGPEFESDWLGRWPSAGEHAVWSDALWQVAAAPLDPRSVVFDLAALPEIGSDTAGAGKDLTEMHSRWGCYSLAHEAHHGWKATRIQGRLIEVCRELAELATTVRREKMGPGVPAVTPQEIPVKVDDANEGGAIVAYLQEAGYLAVGVIAASQAANPVRYPNKRSELWFTTAKLAAVGAALFGLLPADVLAKLRIQSKAPKWKQNSRGQREVEPKDVTKEKLGRSPDGMDALNLAFYDGCAWEAPSAVDVPKPSMEQRQQRSERAEERPTRRMFGR